MSRELAVTKVFDPVFIAWLRSYCKPRKLEIFFAKIYNSNYTSFNICNKRTLTTYAMASIKVERGGSVVFSFYVTEDRAEYSIPTRVIATIPERGMTVYGVEAKLTWHEIEHDLDDLIYNE